MSSENNTQIIVNPVDTYVVVQKRRIYKKKVTTETTEGDASVFEPDIDDISSTMSVLSLDEQKTKPKQNTVEIVNPTTPVIMDDESSKHIVVMEQTQNTSSIDEVTSQPVKKPKAPRKPKVVPVDGETSNETAPVEKKVKAPRKPKVAPVVGEASNDATVTTPVVGETVAVEGSSETTPVVKKIRAPRKPKAVPVVGETVAVEGLNETAPVVGETAPVVKKVRAPRKPKAVPVVGETVAVEGSNEKKKRVVKKQDKSEKQSDENQIKLHSSELPKNIEQFSNILKSFIKQTNRYTTLAEDKQGVIYPVFLKITGDFNEESNNYPCEFYKVQYTTDEETGYITCKPNWSSILKKGVLSMNQCFNILPFDRDVNYMYLQPLQTPVD